MKSFFFKNLFKGFWISFLVFLVYMVIDFLYYGLPDTKAWMATIGSKSIWSLVLAIIYTIVYHTSTNWRPVRPENYLTPAAKYLNSVVFSLLISMMFIAVIALSDFLITILFVDLLDAFRGIPSNPGDTGVLIGKVIVGGVVVEVCGQNQSDTPRG